MWVGLLIFYVANVANVTIVIQVHFVGFSNKDCWIFQQPFPCKSRTFHRISKRAEYGISEDRVRKIIRSP